MPDDGDNGKGAGSSTPTMTKDDVKDIVQDILSATKGDPNDALERLVRRNERLQTKLEEAQAKIPDSSRVLSDSQVQLFEAYKKLGKPEDIVTALSERDDLKTTAALRDRERALRDAAGHHEMNPGLLVRLALQDDLVVDEVREEEGADGENHKVAYVRENKDGSKPVRLDKYAHDEWAEFVEGLSSEPKEAGESRPSGPRLPPAAAKGTGTKATGPITHEVVRDKKLATGKYVRF